MFCSPSSLPHVLNADCAPRFNLNKIVSNSFVFTPSPLQFHGLMSLTKIGSFLELLQFCIHGTINVVDNDSLTILQNRLFNLSQNGAQLKVFLYG